MEKELDLIASGKKKKLDFLMEFYNTLENTIKTSPEVAGSAAAIAEEKICPVCGAPMVVRRSRFGKLFYGCSKYPKCNGLLNIS
jgi:DNA topoisomerase-1